MADTRVQVEVEDGVRENWMVQNYGCQFNRTRIKLVSGGVFDFDAVSNDKSIAACISTSGSRTSGGRLGVGKLLKLRSDMLFLHMAEGVDRRLIVLTEPDMLQRCMQEVSGGRVPPNIEFVLATIPDDLRSRLVAARAKAAKEVTPELVEQLPDEMLTGSSAA